MDLGARLGLPNFVNAEGGPRYRDYADYMQMHERRAGIGPLMGFRGDGTATGRGAPNPDQIERYKANGGFFVAEVPEGARFYKPWNRAYQDWAVTMGFYDQPQPYLFQIYAEPMRRFQLAAEGFSERQPPERLRARILSTMDPLPVWYPPFGDEAGAEYPLHALTQRPMAMYHSWGSQNAWLRQIHGVNPLYVPTKVWAEHGFADGDWARVTSPSGTITVPVAHMAALNEHTVWTWNAIGKRKGTWASGRRRARGDQGVPAEPPDPRTAARTRRRTPLDEFRPDHRAGSVVRSAGQNRKGRGAGSGAARLPAAALRGDGMTTLPPPSAKKLGLVIDLDTCVGCQACVTACKGWNDQGYGAPLSDTDAYGAEPVGTFLNRVHSYEVQPADATAQIINFPRSCLHCEDAPCVTVCPTGASYKRAEDGIVLVNEDACIGCGLCAWACPYGARELDPAAGVMKKCTLCVDRIYNREPAGGGPRTRLRADLPDECAAFRRSGRSGLGGQQAGRGTRRI